MKVLSSKHNLIGNVLQLTDTKYYTKNSRYLPFCDMVYFVPAWSLFAGPVTNDKFWIYSYIVSSKLEDIRFRCWLQISHKLKITLQPKPYCTKCMYISRIPALSTILMFVAKYPVATCSFHTACFWWHFTV